MSATPPVVPEKEPVATFNSNQEDKFVSKRYANLKSDVVEITHDKLENVLLKFYKRHLLRAAWFNPLSLSIGVALTLTTTEFKAKALGMEGPMWKAVFLIGLIGSLLWLVIVVVKLALCWKDTSLESLIDKIKNVSGSGA